MLKITERGWPGHYIMGYACLFRRNTLIEFGDKKVIVSTVGNKIKDMNNPRNGFDTVGYNRWFETMAFWAKEERGYIDIIADREISFVSDWCIYAETEEELHTKYPAVDNIANEMHEAVVRELATKLMCGELIEEKEE